MKKVIVGFLSMVLVLLSASFAGASLKVVGDVGYYAPNYGQINEELSVINALTGMNLHFGSGIICGIGLADEVGDLEVRLEYNAFILKIGDTYSDSYTIGGTTYLINGMTEMELTTNPIILSLIYSFSPGASLSPYVGVGLGLFSTKLTGESRYVEYDEDGVLVDAYSDKGSYTDSPIGFLILAGVRKDMTKNLILRGEVRYVSAKATFTDETVSPAWSVDCDLGGFMGSVGVEYKF